MNSVIDGAAAMSLLSLLLAPSLGCLGVWLAQPLAGLCTLAVIRLKDGCRPFNPKERAALFDPEDPLHNVGIRMASRLSRRMEYHFILGMNVLTITL